MMIFKVLIISITATFISLQCSAQVFDDGDILVNANYGTPQVTPLVLRTSLKLYYKARTNEDFNFTIKNSGVFNIKTEYGVVDNMGVGLVASYWDMTLGMTNNYKDNHPVTGLNENFVDAYDVKISALAFGLRGNYHFFDDTEDSKFDPYYGATLGVTKYNYDLKFASTFPDKQLPMNGYKFKSGWGPYFSSTFGIRYFPIKYVGLNAEIGWDRGAFLFFGVALKIHTKPLTVFDEW